MTALIILLALVLFFQIITILSIAGVASKTERKIDEVVLQLIRIRILTDNKGDAT